MERCVDANVAIKWVIATESEREKALALLQDSIRAGITLIAPPLFPVEVDSIISKRVHNGSGKQIDHPCRFTDITASRAF
jgi:predicted nucleic acid-binding protein